MIKQQTKSMTADTRIKWTDEFMTVLRSEKWPASARVGMALRVRKSGQLKAKSSKVKVSAKKFQTEIGCCVRRNNVAKG